MAVCVLIYERPRGRFPLWQFAMVNGTTNAHLSEVYAWCVDQLGPPGRGGDHLWASIYLTFEVYHVVQAVAFRLRWC